MLFLGPEFSSIGWSQVTAVMAAIADLALGVQSSIFSCELFRINLPKRELPGVPPSNLSHLFLISMSDSTLHLAAQIRNLEMAYSFSIF